MQFKRLGRSPIQVSKICMVAPRTASKWIDSGKLKGYRIPGSTDRRVPRANLIAFMRENGMELGALADVNAYPVLLVCVPRLLVASLAARRPCGPWTTRTSVASRIPAGPWVQTDAPRTMTAGGEARGPAFRAGAGRTNGKSSTSPSPSIPAATTPLVRQRPASTSAGTLARIE